MRKKLNFALNAAKNYSSNALNVARHLRSWQSFVINGEGALLAQLPAFETAVQVIDLDTAAPIKPPELDAQKELFQALVLGVRDFVRKNRLERVFLGLSGGIDSSLVAIIAAEAVGPENVTAVAIPSRYSDPRSTTCARELAGTLGFTSEGLTAWLQSHFNVNGLEAIRGRDLARRIIGALTAIQKARVPSPPKGIGANR